VSQVHKQRMREKMREEADELEALSSRQLYILHEGNSYDSLYF
jgi:hypothetical protein